jgi:hypothetical protein
VIIPQQLVDNVYQALVSFPLILLIFMGYLLGGSTDFNASIDSEEDLQNFWLCRLAALESVKTLLEFAEKYILTQIVQHVIFG